MFCEKSEKCLCFATKRGKCRDEILSLSHYVSRSISSLSLHFLSNSSYSFHFLLISSILSPFPHSLSISSFPLHFLILSPFPGSPAARLQQVAQPCFGLIFIPMDRFGASKGTKLGKEPSLESPCILHNNMATSIWITSG